jgi:hypothetical protein
MKSEISWSAAGSEAKRRFRAAIGFQFLCAKQRPKAVSPLRSATAVQDAP